MALQTKTFTVGAPDTPALSGYALDLILTETAVSVAENTSAIDYVLQLRSGYTRFSQYRTGAQIRLNGTLVASQPFDYEHQLSIGRYETLVILSGSCTVAHNEDGTLEMSVEFSIEQEKASYTPGSVSITGETMTLTRIDREHTIRATDASIGGTSAVMLAGSTAQLRHSVAYSFGALRGYLSETGVPVENEEIFAANSIGFQIPEAFYDQIPESPSGICTLTCRTYAGERLVGQPKSCTLTVNADPALCAPEISGTVVDVNEVTKALTGDERALIQYCSSALCTMTARGRNGASVTQKKIAGHIVSGDTLQLDGVETGSFTFWAKDSRGFETQLRVGAKTLIPYIRLTNNAVGSRTDPTSGNAQLRVSGNFYSGSFGAAENTLSVAYVGADGVEIPMEAIVSGSRYSAQASLSGLDYTQSHTFQVVVRDAISTITRQVTIGQGIPVFDWGRDYFRVNVPAAFPGGIRDLPVRENLLDNSDFTQAVDQRRLGVTTAGAYCLDRWIAQDSGIRYTQTPEGMYFSGEAGVQAGICQKLSQGSRLYGKTLTAAVCVDSQVICCTATLPDAPAQSYTVLARGETGGMEILLTDLGDGGAYAPAVLIQRQSGVSDGFTLQWAAVYVGSFPAEALPPYLPKGYGAELSQCRRYFIRCDAQAGSAFGTLCGMITNGATRMYFPLPGPMGGVPQVTARGLGVIRTVSGYAAAAGFTTGAGGDLSGLTAVGGNASFYLEFPEALCPVNNTPGVLTLMQEAAIELSADL